MSGAVQMAPTAKLQKHKHELELMKMKIACQEDLIKELTKERDFLTDQLSQSKSIITVFHQYFEYYVNIFCNNGVFICFIYFSELIFILYSFLYFTLSFLTCDSDTTTLMLL